MAERYSALASDLRRVVGGEVRFDPGTRAMYATDGSNYRQVPIGVVIPRHVDDVVATVEVCRRHGAPVLSRGGGTSLAGQCCNVAVVIEFSKYLNRVLSIDAEARIARVEPGVVLDELQREAAAHGLIFGPDPATHKHCTLGGMVGNNSCGIHALMSQFYGPGARTSDNTQRIEIVTSMTGCECGSAARLTISCARSSRRVDGAGRFTPRCSSCATLTPISFAHGIRIFPGGSPVTTLTSFSPNAVSTSHVRWSARSRPASRSCRPR